jgi:hypothetical protein
MIRRLIGVLITVSLGITTVGGCFTYRESDLAVPTAEQFPSSGLVTLDSGELRRLSRMRLVADTLYAWDLDKRTEIRIPRSGFYLVRGRVVDVRRTVAFIVLGGIIGYVIIAMPQKHQRNTFPAPI